MIAFNAIFRRELHAYFVSPLAYVFIAVFLVALGVFTWDVGRFFATNRADLAPFFTFHPWLYMIFLPAITMRLWAEEIRTGTFELLMTAGTPLITLVTAKFVAAWLLAGVALALTLPMWLTVNYLGSPDNPAIALTYLISFLVAGAYIAIGSAMSAVTANQVIAFVLSVVLAFLFTASGLPLVVTSVAGTFGNTVATALASLSFLEHFGTSLRGVLRLHSVIYLVSVIALFLSLTIIWLQQRREVS